MAGLTIANRIATLAALARRRNALLPGTQSAETDVASRRRPSCPHTNIHAEYPEGVNGCTGSWKSSLASLAPEVLEPRRRQLGVSGGVLDVAVAEPGLESPRVMSRFARANPHACRSKWG